MIGWEHEAGRQYSYVSPTERTMVIPAPRGPRHRLPGRAVVGAVLLALWGVGAAAALATVWAVTAHAPSLLLIGGAR